MRHISNFGIYLLLYVVIGYRKMVMSTLNVYMCMYLVVFDGVVAQAMSLPEALKDLTGITIWIHTGKDG